MVAQNHSKILIGISLHQEESKELLSWAITLLARPNDHVIAVHILVGKQRKGSELATRHQSQLRRAKASVISVLGEFAGACQSKQVNLEARVGFSTGVGRGLIEEATYVLADYLVLGGSRIQSRRPRIGKFCFRNAPDGCNLVFFAKTKSTSDSTCSEVSLQLSSNLTNKSVKSDTASESETKNSSPRTVLDEHEEQNSNSGGSSITSGSVTPSFTSKSSSTKHGFFPCTLIFSLLGSPFRKRNFIHKQTKQPLLRCFSYDEIMNATNNFSPDNIVGRGGYSEVYRGDLCDGQTIAVKRLAKNENDTNKEKDFLTELGAIGQVSHPNTASLVGCCIENGLYLIFNFSQNGNLSSALHGKENAGLEWPVRYKIAVGVGRGLHYLHKRCKHRIIHRDIKASNVLLGPDYEPQITDFGLAKWLPNKWTHHAVIPIEGTFGYLAPEYFMHGIVDEKTDVFAFGVLLLEIVTGRRPVDSSKRNLLAWAKPLMESGEIAKLADPRMEGKYDLEELHKLILAASYCIRQSSIWRPSMTEVLELLTNGSGSEVTKSRRIPKFSSDDLDDYSMVYGYGVSTEISLEDSFTM